MAKFGKSSLEKLATLHPDLQKVLNEAIKYVDFTILQGHRGEKEQNEAYAQGKSKLKFPNSKHNSNPSRAVDVALYPIDWNNRESFVRLCSFIQGIGAALGIKMRYGGDWDSDGLTTDEKFSDLPHLELI